MQRPKLKWRHDRTTMENEEMEALRKENCMCLHCRKMRPGQPGHCQLAAAFFKICKRGNNAFIMTRCKDWMPEGDLEL